MIDELRRRARVRGFEALCAFTHQPAYFARLDFSIVPHTWLPEKISADCSVCPLFRRCGQYAMLVEVEPAPRARAAFTALQCLTPDPRPSRQIEAAAGGITAPLGFRASGVACGIKASQLDLALVVADGPASAAGLFTTNQAQAAPVVVSRAHLERSGARPARVVANSGCANACTGAAGLEVARRTAETRRRAALAAASRRSWWPRRGSSASASTRTRSCEASRRPRARSDGTATRTRPGPS